MSNSTVTRTWLSTLAGIVGGMIVGGVGTTLFLLGTGSWHLSAAKPYELAALGGVVLVGIVGSALAGVAIGLLAVGAIAIGKLEVARARLGRVEIDDVQVRRLHVLERVDTPAET